MLSLLEAKGLIKLKEGIDKTAAELKDIDENPKTLNSMQILHQKCLYKCTKMMKAMQY